MLTIAEQGKLEEVAQDITNGELPFVQIQPKIEAIASTRDLEWDQTRIRKDPVAAAIGHTIGCRIMEIEEDINLDSPDTEGTAYDEYLALTASIDMAAGRQVIEEWREDEGTHGDAFNYYLEQMGAHVEHVKENAGTTAQRGKEELSDESITPEDALVGQVSESSKLTLPSIIVRQAVQLCRYTTSLPPAEEIAKHLTNTLTSHTDQSMLPLSVFTYHQFGRKAACKRTRELREQHKTDLTIEVWIDALNRQASGQTLAPSMHEVVDGLPDDIFAVPSSRMRGYCTAQFPLEPYEPGVSGANAARAAAFFARHSIVLPNNKFRLADYQMLRSIEAAKKTFLADPDYRRAIEALASLNPRA